MSTSVLARLGYSLLLRAAEAPEAPPVEVEASTDFNLLSAIGHAGFAEQLVMLLLGVFSVLSWAIIVYKVGRLRKAFAQSDRFLDLFWGSKRLDEVFSRAEDFGSSPLAQVFRAGYIELAKLKKRSQDQSETGMDDLDNIERSLRRASAAERTQLESLVPFLATTGSTAPFIGLLGTVLGIFTAFQKISDVGNASLATVAPGVGGALVATAIGLFAAIPAVMAYNYFVGRIRVLSTEMNNFSSDFLNIVKRNFF